MNFPSIYNQGLQITWNLGSATEKIPGMHTASHISAVSFGSTYYNVWLHGEQSQEHTQVPNWDKVHPSQLLRRSSASKTQHLDGQEDAWFATLCSYTSYPGEPFLSQQFHHFPNILPGLPRKIDEQSHCICTSK